MKHAYVFPGQGSQFPGMAKEHYDNSIFAKKLVERANEILGFRISDIMFGGSEEDLKQTNVTQPAVFLHSIIAYRTIESAKPEMVAGHSLGEFSALVANGTLSFEDALQLVAVRARAMQKACEINPSTMAAVLNLADDKVEAICAVILISTNIFSCVIYFFGKFRIDSHLLFYNFIRSAPDSFLTINNNTNR